MNLLLDLELDEVSLVDSPANQSATVALYKRDTTMKEDDKVKEELEIDTSEEDSDGVDGKETRKSDSELALEAEVETLKAQVEELSKALEDAKAETVTKAEEMIEVEGEMIAKSSVPAPILKKLEDLQKAAEAEAIRKRADEILPNFKGTADQRGKLLKAVGNDEEVIEMLRAADALFGELFKEIGKTDSNADMKTPKEKLDAMVKAYQEEKKVDFFKAYAAVTKTAEGKELLLKSYNDK